MKKYLKPLSATAMVLACASASATDYRFKVSCTDKIFVEVWRTGAVDLGQVYFLGQTHLRNPGCNVADFNKNTDSGHPQVTHEGASAVLKAIPIIGSLFR